MLKQENTTINGKEFMRHYSTENKYIIQLETGIEYEEAVDVIPCKYTYAETNREITQEGDYE